MGWWRYKLNGHPHRFVHPQIHPETRGEKLERNEEKNCAFEHCDDVEEVAVMAHSCDRIGKLASEESVSRSILVLRGTNASPIVLQHRGGEWDIEFN